MQGRWQCAVTHRFDQAPLAQWLGANVSCYAGPLIIEQFRGGQSNPTYKLITPQKTYVLRRKPPGVLLKGAHDVEREAMVVSALGDIEFPVAHVYGVCANSAIVGTRFYVMDYVEGRIIWDVTFPSIERGASRVFRRHERDHCTSP